MNMRLGMTHIVVDSDRDLPTGQGYLTCSSLQVTAMTEIARHHMTFGEKKLTIIRKS